jgi:hypothetical protein
MAEAALIEKFGDAGYERIRLWLNERCGIHYAEKKKELLAQRLARVLELIFNTCDPGAGVNH